MPDKALVNRVETRITESLIEFGAEPGEIAREAEFEALDIDSLDLVELAQIIEEEFGVVIENEDAEEMVTVGDVLDFVNARLP
jgi:acyl carrier protein